MEEWRFVHVSTVSLMTKGKCALAKIAQENPNEASHDISKKYMCVGGDRHCLSIFAILEEKQKIFFQSIISTTCLSYEMRCQFFCVYLSPTSVHILLP